MHTVRLRLFFATLGCFAALSGFALSGENRSQGTGKLRFNRDIRPILSKNCFPCHGFDEKSRKAELRLDTAEGAVAITEGRAAVYPFDLSKSNLWHRITATDVDVKMPPPDSHLELTSEEIHTLRAWIVQGAEYESHWSFMVPERTPLPAASTQESVNPVDAFIDDRLRQMKLVANGRADRSVLLRRIHLDLTGLPPSVEEMDSFLNDLGPEAWQRKMESLLDSPHYGERMAMEWLDASRYADTNGFSIDGGRHMWLWRDWVIQAFNDNMPYDQFLVEQIAGDLLPNRTESQWIATGFQRNNMVTHEGGTIPEENLTNYNADRVKTFGEVILGLTLGCAQCHNHKFDPFTQKDYYRLFAYFNTLSDKGLDGNAGVNPAPYVSMRTVLRTEELDSLREQIQSLESKLSERDDRILLPWIAQQQQNLAARGKDFAIHPVKVLKVSTPNRGAGFEVVGESQVRIRNAGDLGAFDVLVELPRIDQPITAIRMRALPQEDLPGGGWGTGLSKPLPKGAAKKDGEGPQEKGSFRLTSISITLDTVPSDQINLHRLESISRVTANSWEDKNLPHHCLDPRNENGWSPSRDTEGPVHLTATLSQPASSENTPYMTVQLNFGAGKSHIPGLVELYAISGNDDGTDLPETVLASIQKTEQDRDQSDWTTLWEHCAKNSDALKRTRIDLANLKERLAVLTEPFPTMVMDQSEKPRETFILNRGDYAQPTDPVTADTPESIGPKQEDAPKNRLGLASWVVDTRNPLTARVAVNRLWKIFFGTGLVSTAADFGSQGEWPSHPELLDWLAVELMENDWDLQHILKIIVTSNAYQRSSHSSVEQMATDPQNRWLARGPRFRLSAEMVRDMALAVSGLYVDRIGGPSVNPYTPADLWREVSHYGSTPATAQAFVQDHGDKLYRRSMYTYWKRTAPPPNMMAFDAPNREVCTISRAATTTPLQALVLLNDVQFVEAARVFAERILSAEDGTEDRLRFAFKRALSRNPTEAEMRVLSTALQKEWKRYESNPEAAKTVVSSGEFPRDERFSSVEHAAWTQIASLILNLSEAITRN